MSKNKRYLTIYKFNAKFIATVLMLDNHCLGVSDCHKIVRVGTVLFNLPKLAEIDMLHFLEKRSSELHSWYGDCPIGD